MIPLRDTHSLALLYHLNSQPRPAVEPQAANIYEVQYKDVFDEAAGGPVQLPPPDATVVAELQQRRQSCRAYLPREMPLADLAVLLRGTYAITSLRELPGGFVYAARTVPSAGGLYPLELYAFAQRVQGLADGLYHYDVRGHELQPLRTGALLRDVGASFLEQYYFADANLLIVVSAVFGRTLKKYGARGYRYILLEAGHAAQNLCLLAAERQLDTLCLGGFSDTLLNPLLGIDGVGEAAIYAVAVGYRAE
jgi:SagB-type dehydrogenase family enzyme